MTKTIRKGHTRSMDWKHTLIIDYGALTSNMKGAKRYKLTKGKYTIDVSIGKDALQNGQYPGANQVSIYSQDYGGWLLDTPKSFATIAQTNAFISKAKQKLSDGNEGYKVAFPD